jgi:predicted RNase H-like nuclease (RuvC/YqgF family)
MQLRIQGIQREKHMDIGTATDFIKDLQEENARLHQAIANLCNEMVVLESERDDLQRQLDRLAQYDQ